MRYLRFSQAEKDAKDDHQDLEGASQEPTKLAQNLASALSDIVILPNDVAFKHSMAYYFAEQEREVVPACFVRPNSVQQLSQAIATIKHEYIEQGAQNQGIFAIRGGGHSIVSGAASLKGGVVIDLGLFCDVIPSGDRSSVMIGAGSKWRHVSQVLDKAGLAVVGGRNSDVGVGGLTLGGGLSFFSSRYGLVCSNVLEYELVLASGAVAIASSSTNPDLWRALKGGSNNFGVVTRFKVRCFPCTNIWSGWLFIPAFSATKVLAAFQECVSNSYDDHAAGPIATFSYIHKVGIQVSAVGLTYTASPENKKWPAYWRASPFGSPWRFWSFWNTCKVRSLTNATDENNTFDPPGKRQTLATTTVKNDAATLTAIYAVYNDAITSFSRKKIRGMFFTLVLQPVLPDWIRRGDANIMGLQDTNEPYVIVSFPSNWADSRDDDFVMTTTRHAIEQIDIFAAHHDTGHSFRYLNYAAGWQKPFNGYGKDNLQFLRDMSRKYDPDGLFQKGCAGGFKLHDAERGEEGGEESKS